MLPHDMRRAGTEKPCGYHSGQRRRGNAAGNEEPCARWGNMQCTAGSEGGMHDCILGADQVGMSIKNKVIIIFKM